MLLPQTIDREINCSINLTLLDSNSEVATDAGPVDSSGFTINSPRDEVRIRARTLLRDSPSDGGLTRRYIDDYVKATTINGSKAVKVIQRGVLEGEDVDISEDGNVTFPAGIEAPESSWLEKDLTVDLDFQSFLSSLKPGEKCDPVAVKQFLQSLWVTSVPPWKFPEFANTGTWPAMHVVLVPKLPASANAWIDSIVESQSKAYFVDRSAEASVLRVECAGELSGEEMLHCFPGDARYSEDDFGYEGELTWTFSGEARLAWDGGKFRAASVEGEVEIHLNNSWEYLWDGPRIEKLRAVFGERWKGTLWFASKSIALSDAR